MARQPRLALAGRPHYLVQRSVHGQALATDDVDRQALVDALGEAARAEGVAIWAYALLDQELHVLACPGQAVSLGRMMQRLGRRYVAAFNRRHERRGALWGGRFRAAVVEEGECLLTVLVLIDGRVAEGDPWSSRMHRLGQRREAWLEEPPELWALGNTPFEREIGFRDRLERGVPVAERSRIEQALRGGWAIGSAPFVATIAQESGQAAAPRARGRPRLVR